MNKLLYILSLVSISCTFFASQQNLEKPTLEQLLNTDTIEISLSCKRDCDKRGVNMESWLNIAKATDTLIDKCYIYPDEKDEELFEEVCNTIRYIRNEQRATHAQGINRLLFVAGQTNQIRQEIALNEQSFILINSINDAQTDQLLELCHQAWWAKERTRQELDVILENSLFLVLIDSSNQKIIGFIRAVTDYARFAGIFDVMVDNTYQGKGLGKLLVEKLLEHPIISKVPLIELHCLDDKVDFYQKFGFEVDFGKLVPMRLKRK
jgi:ribosomal protein S18 acetylase RimI-like enzyme